MNRLEFIESCRNLSQQELEKIAKESRDRANGRIPESVTLMFRSLDEASDVRELYVETEFGKTHVFVVAPANPGKTLPVVINVHGGGWSLDHGERDIYFSRRLAVKASVLVVDVDYVLAPEYPYPAALEELEALYRKLPGLLKEWGGDPERVVVCGQSAGGNLAAAVSQRKQYGDDLKIQGQILCYLPADNYHDHFNGQELDERGMSTEYYGFFYNRNFEERANHDVSVALSTIDEVKDVPPADIVTAGLDNLMPEGKAYYDLLKKAGVPATYRCFEKSRHGFLVNLYDEWQEGESYVTELIRKYLH